MQRNIKLAIAMAILIAGLSAALLFRRESSVAAEGEGQSAENLSYRAAESAASEPVAVTFPEPVAAAAPAAVGTAIAPWVTEPIGASSAANPGQSTGQYDAVPTLPSHYDPSGPASSAARPAVPSATSSAAPPAPPGSSAEWALSGGGSVSPASPPRTHRIVDGDTLGQIASDYLGDATRQAEILKLNRDVLGDSPDLLPIGAVLKIPPRAAPGTGSTTPLVPIPSGALRH